MIDMKTSNVSFTRIDLFYSRFLKKTERVVPNIYSHAPKIIKITKNTMFLPYGLLFVKVVK
jgi:hypothetical protein